MRPSVSTPGVVIVVCLVLLAACASGEEAGSAPAGSTQRPLDSTVGSTAAVDYAELAGELTPVASRLGWEIQRAYRQDAYLLGREVELVNVYLRPSGGEPPPEQYVTDISSATQAFASHLFASDGSVTAIDVCLQHANDEPPGTDVPPAVRMLGLRDDLAPLLDGGVQLVDLATISQQGRLILFADDAVRLTAAWEATVAGGTSDSGG